jgi:hypothetical protein
MLNTFSIQGRRNHRHRPLRLVYPRRYLRLLSGDERVKRLGRRRRGRKASVFPTTKLIQANLAGPEPNSHQGILKGESIPVLLTSCLTGLKSTDNFCFYLQNRLIQTSQTGGQR